MRKPRSSPRPHPAPTPRSTLIRSPFATLFFLSAVGLLLWGRLLLKEVPQTASAVDTPAAEARLPSPAASPDEASPEDPRVSAVPAASAGKVGG